MDLGGRAGGARDLAQESAFALIALDEMHKRPRLIGELDGENHAGKAGAGAEVDPPPCRGGERQELGLRRDLLREAMKLLTGRERDILVERRLKDEPATLEDLSEKYGISRERVRQIEVRAFEKLQKAIKSKAIQNHPALH